MIRKNRSATHCSYCRREILSILSVPGKCAECGALLCIDCWTIQRRRLCENHQVEIPSPKKDVPTKARCGKCGRTIRDDSNIAGQCENESCSALLCNRCWEVEHFCKIHLPTLEEKIERAKRLLKKGQIKCLVSRETAKAREMNFISRFDLKLSQASSLTDPVSQKKYILKVRPGGRATFDDRDKLRKISQEKFTLKKIEDTIPLNIRSRYEIASPKLPSFAKVKGKVVIEAFSFCHLRAYLKDGFDTSPASLSDLASLISGYTKSAGQEEGYYISGVASPTGWEEEALAYIDSEEARGTFANQRLSICLLDGETGELRYNRLDERILPFLDFFTPELNSEKVEKCIGYVRDKLVLADHVSLTEAARELHISQEIAKEAFEKLVGEDNFIVDNIKEMGLVISPRP